MVKKSKPQEAAVWDQEGKRVCICSACGDRYVVRKRGFWQNTIRCPSCTSVPRIGQKG